MQVHRESKLTLMTTQSLYVWRDGAATSRASSRCTDLGTDAHTGLNAHTARRNVRTGCASDERNTCVRQSPHDVMLAAGVHASAR